MAARRLTHKVSLTTPSMPTRTLPRERPTATTSLPTSTPIVEPDTAWSCALAICVSRNSDSLLGTRRIVRNLKLPQNASFDRRGGSVTLTMTTPNRFPMDSRLEKSLTVGLTAMLAGCVSVEGPSPPGYRPISATEGGALVGRLLPDGVKDRAGWARSED